MARHHVVAALAALAFIGTAQAQFFKEPALEALLTSSRYAELDKAAAARVAVRPDDAQAVLALAVLSMRGSGNATDEANRRKAAITQAEACLQRQPDAAACHYALGVVLGVQAMSEGMLKAAGSVGRIKEALAQAVALDAQWYPARSALTEFYLLAPGVMGGSTSKARELARGASNAEQTRALDARVLIDAEKFDAALLALAQVRSGSDRTLADDVADWTFAAGLGLLNEGQPERARAAFERLVRERPDDPTGLWGLARVQAESGAHAEALKLLARIAPLEGAEAFPLDYRIGISLQALGQKDAARAALSRFVGAGKGSKKALDDAKARLDKLAA